MKKIIVSMLVVGLIFITACSKVSNGPSGGTWTFKGATYTSYFTNFALGAYTSYTMKTYPTGSLQIYFDDTVPTKTSYKIGSYYPIAGSGQTYLKFTDTARIRIYTSLQNDNNYLNVTKGADGKFSVSFTNVEMVSSTNPSDSAAMSGSLNQTP